ncbi:nucleotidyltransferase domain-containing protein [Candidatus Microgenomates bacterium]|nr:nucleotidyltransferase domain-containing protein [Candidatus Microgenomates bacterium]
MTIPRSTIKAKLKEIEEKEQVRVLYAVESGSRGWGFESKNSDYDIRFIYVHSSDWYLSINDKRDVIEVLLSQQLDISGWDIKKALQLFQKSNPPLYEWLTSPIVYVEQGNFAQRLRLLMPSFYSPISCLNHYLHMAKGNYREYLQSEKVRVKKYFYVLRPILACMWIEKHQTMPPMEFEKVFRSQKLDKNLADQIQKLYIRKKSSKELDIEDRIEAINDFLEEKIKYFEENAKKFSPSQSKNENSLDELFRDILNE